MPRIFSLMLLAGLCFGGQSINLAVNTGTASLPARSTGQDFRIEFQMHTGSGNFVAPASYKYLAQLSGYGVRFLHKENNTLWVQDTGDSIAGGSDCQMALTDKSNVLVRLQRRTADMTFTCEMWNVDGSGYAATTLTITALGGAGGSGATISESGATPWFGFLRIIDSIVATSSQQPVTYTSSATRVWWKFDNGVTDSSSNGYNLTWTSPAYMATPGQSTIISRPKTSTANTWTDWLPFRAGHHGTLNGDASFTMSDSSATPVSYFWQCVESPASAPTFSTRTASTTTVTGLSFGGYTFRLTVADADGNTASTDLRMGAVAMDDNGIVVLPDSRLDKIFGPMIAYGSNPWEFHDQSAYLTTEYHANDQKWYNPAGSLTRDFETQLTGTVSFTEGSTTVTGTGTNFQTELCGGGTTPVYSVVLWWDVTGASPDYPPLPKIAPGGLSPTLMEVATCNSQTQLTLTRGFYYATGTQSGKPWGKYCCGWWYGQTGSSTYYDGPLALYAMYYRSGNTKYRDAARWLADGFIANPANGFGASVQMSSRVVNLTSATIRNAIDGGANYTYVKQLYNRNGGTPSLGLLISDPREAGYEFSWKALQALVETDPTEKAAALTYLRDSYTNRWQPQQRANGNYWGNYFENNYGGGSFTVTPGSAVVTGSGIGSTKCYPGAVHSDLATASVTNGSTSITGGSGWTGLAGKLAEVYGQRDGNYYIFFSPIASSTATTLTTIYPYDGTTNTGGNVRVRIIDSDDYSSVWFATTSNVQEQTFYTCTWNSSTQITLDRPYEGSCAGAACNKYLSRANAAGRGSQPFQMGIIATALNWASEALAADYPTDSANYLTLADNVGKWIKDYGYRTAHKGLYYLVDFPNCIPFQEYGCSLSLKESRDLSAEATSAMTVVYQKSPTQPNKDFGDEFYGAQWGKLGGPYSDGQWNQYDAPAQYQQGKYLGFAFGMGMSHQWPAARLGGVAPEDLRTYSYGFTLPSGADKIQLTVMRPSGETVSPTACTTSPCTFTYDARQGKHLVRHTYQTTAGASRGVSDWREIQ